MGNSSLEQLLSSHKVDPAYVLASLGFAGSNNKELRRLPQRFLIQSSAAHGISVKDYVDSSKKLNTFIENKKNIAIQSESARLSTANQGEPHTSVYCIQALCWLTNYSTSFECVSACVCWYICVQLVVNDCVICVG